MTRHQAVMRWARRRSAAARLLGWLRWERAGQVEREWWDLVKP